MFIAFVDDGIAPARPADAVDGPRCRHGDGLGAYKPHRDIFATSFSFPLGDTEFRRISLIVDELLPLISIYYFHYLLIHYLPRFAMIIIILSIFFSRF